MSGFTESADLTGPGVAARLLYVLLLATGTVLNLQ
jgi:hypothetical protein